MDTAHEFEEMFAKYQKLAAEDEDAARAFMQAEFPKLSEESQNRLTLEMLTIAMEDSVANRDALITIAEKGAAAIDALDTLEKEIQEEGSVS